MHIITGILLIFFIFYNAIGTTGSITNKWYVNKKRYIDIKVVRWILGLRRKKFREINEDAYYKTRYLPFILLIFAYVIALLFKGSRTALHVITLILILMLILLFGLVSFKKLVKGIREGIKTTVFYGFLAILFLFIIWISGDKHTFNLFLVMLQNPIQEFYLNIKSLHAINVDGYSPYVIAFIGFLIFALLCLFIWVIYRLCAVLIMVILIATAKFCYILNNNSPLKTFYLLFQISSVFITELVAKSIAS